MFCFNLPSLLYHFTGVCAVVRADSTFPLAVKQSRLCKQLSCKNVCPTTDYVIREGPFMVLPHSITSYIKLSLATVPRGTFCVVSKIRNNVLE